MRSLKGFVLKQSEKSENDGKTEKIHPTEGTSMKIGSSFVCHLIVEQLEDVHFDISLNEYNQVSRTEKCLRIRHNYTAIWFPGGDPEPQSIVSCLDKWSAFA